MSASQNNNIIERVLKFRKQLGINKELHTHMLMPEEIPSAVSWGQSPHHPHIQDTELVYGKSKMATLLVQYS